MSLTPHNFDEDFKSLMDKYIDQEWFYGIAMCAVFPSESRECIFFNTQATGLYADSLHSKIHLMAREAARVCVGMAPSCVQE